MKKEDVSKKKKIKEIADRFCNTSFDEILNLPDPEGYEYIDRLYDQILESHKKSVQTLNIKFKEN